jgi:hypothetical protein
MYQTWANSENIATNERPNERKSKITPIMQKNTDMSL